MKIILEKFLALVGGIDYKESTFNRVVQSERQPGSAIKPFLYHTAIEFGYSPASQVADIGRTYEYKVGEEEKSGNLKIMGEHLKG
ncbi:MAG: penicillin-binding transpeptidase domain-containing protein [Halarcobacter sp.]